MVAAHGSASGSVISKGGQEVVSSGGVTIAATLFNGGALIVSAGGTVSGGLTIHAGKATLGGAMGAGQTVDFVGAGGTLKLNNLAAFQAKIAGLSTPAEKIDLGGFAFSVSSETVTWTQAGTSGTLKVQDGAKTASLTLIGTYVTGDFTLTNDGDGGTFVADPPASQAIAAPTATRFVQALAGFGAGRGAPAAIHSGGTATTIAPPLLNATASGAGHG
jgi:autotransporter passenger strand-loop-strand repeat protein